MSGLMRFLTSMMMRIALVVAIPLVWVVRPRSLMGMVGLWPLLLMLRVGGVRLLTCGVMDCAGLNLGGRFITGDVSIQPVPNLL